MSALTLPILCASIAAVLLALSAWRGVLLYRSSFITNIGSRLTRSFVFPANAVGPKAELFTSGHGGCEEDWWYDPFVCAGVPYREIAVYVDELNQVWTNLIDNAIDAMNGSGTLRVSALARDRDVVVERPRRVAA